MGKLDDKVALVTGAARGQGRSHAVRLAQEGARVIAIDVCAPIATIPYDMSSASDLAETVRLVEALDQPIVAAQADVRDTAALEKVLAGAVAEFGRLDIVCANAGVMRLAALLDVDDALWDDLIGVNLTGAFKTVRAAVPHIRAGGRGGSIILTSSSAGIASNPNMAPYVAAKHGVVGLVKSLAKELAAEQIRVNSVLPTTVNTTMAHNEHSYSWFMPDRDPATLTPDDVAPAFQSINLLPVPWVEPVDVSNAIVFLASDDARYITGVQLPVDAGYTTP